MVKFFSKAIHHSIFQKSRVKIVASIMSMLTLVLILTLLIIYLTTLRSVYKSNQHILLDFTEQCIGGLSHDARDDAEDGKNAKAVTERHHGKISVDSNAGYNTFSVVIAITV
ncbi:hypothetical protein [Oribacterium sp. WCC10]|uniref:hypothetical protein n=1 Tax=Oribacterium sp. WCC10 TaxID=1855343 RepID=UPI0008E093B5|nr:hypothetical protein [Oribacterium sp. WCC10]SFG45251.1 hypothetical protein SAMN05216356_10949 [Oribacterium sp. WCC10]